MLQIGMIVKILPDAEYSGKFTGYIGKVKNYFSQNKKVGVELFQQTNDASSKGLFWFSESKVVAAGIRPSMIITKLVTPRLQIIIPPSPRRFGGAFVPLRTITTTLSLLSGRMATTAITLPMILVGCGPALPPNPPQDDPAPIPPPKGGGSGREPQIKIIMAA